MKQQDRVNNVETVPTNRFPSQVCIFAELFLPTILKREFLVSLRRICTTAN